MLKKRPKNTNKAQQWHLFFMMAKEIPGWTSFRALIWLISAESVIQTQEAASSLLPLDNWWGKRMGVKRGVYIHFWVHYISKNANTNRGNWITTCGRLFWAQIWHEIWLPIGTTFPHTQKQWLRAQINWEKYKNITAHSWVANDQVHLLVNAR